MRLILSLVALASSLVAVAAAAQSSCGSVYASAVRNVDVSVRQSAEYSYFYSQHCGTFGELRTSSTSLDLTIPVKQLAIGFNGSREEAKKKMEEFCKTQHEQRTATAYSYSLKDDVVVEALRTFNDCVALEGKNVFVTHTAAEPRSLVVRADFNPSTTNVALRAFVYDAKVARCTSTALSANGAPVLITPQTKEQVIARPFSIVCERTIARGGAATNEARYPRFMAQLDTNHGAYVVTLSEDSVFGFDLANRNKIRHEAMIAERDKAAASARELQKRLDDTDADTKLAVQGQKAPGGFWPHEPCPQNGGDIMRHARSVCGDRKVVGFRELARHSGDRCGYAYFVYACLKK